MRGYSYMKMLMANEEALNNEYKWSMLILLAVVAAVCLLVHRRNVHDRESDETSREIMRNCGMDEEYKDRFSD
ncbi:hypothetical protein [Aristaeella lactis]|uniref:Uncharacterized protein n=1 Tax=Aristaeella lactis TaxID=3046383 RepID=A0AC61PN97_9FIRM|nr:hypothetical protein [Aristaeella lactis]QUA52828.1 hypothetical protein JYE50_14230 [Aristaeella lactis]SMC74050.1 hypothetical protein SAMN06297397_2303 [Aristaeella lactis]